MILKTNITYPKISLKAIKNLIIIYSKSSSNQNFAKAGALSINMLRMSSTDSMLLRKLTHLHSLLCDASICVENFYGFPIVVIVVLHFFNIVFYCYYILEILFGPEQYFKSLNEYGLTGIILAQVISADLQLCGFIEICQKTVRQNQNITMNIHKLMNLNISPDMKDQLKIFASQCEHRKMEFSAAGIFKLDRTFYLMVSF